MHTVKEQGKGCSVLQLIKFIFVLYIQRSTHPSVLALTPNSSMLQQNDPRYCSTKQYRALAS